MFMPEIPREHRNGDCGSTAYHVAHRFHLHGEDALIVHGVPVGQGPYNSGLRFFHAWVETHNDHPLGGIAVDRSNGLDVEMPKVLYYQIGRMDEEHVRRYTLEEAEKHMADTGHFGPWDDGLQDMAEV